MKEQDPEPIAEMLVRASYARTYQYPPRFPGFRASLRAIRSGQTASGTIAVRTRGGIVLTLGPALEQQGWIRHEVGQILHHRLHHPYEVGDGRFHKVLADDDGDPLGWLVLFQDDPFKSAYRLRDERITLINRTMDGITFSIVLQAWQETEDGRLMASRFTVVYRDSAGQLRQTDSYSDHYAEVNGYWLPTVRDVVTVDATGISTRRIVLEEHRILS